MIFMTYEAKTSRAGSSAICAGTLVSLFPRDAHAIIQLRTASPLLRVRSCSIACRPVDRGGSVGSDEPPWLPNGPLEVFRKLIFWPLLTPPIAVTSSVEDCSNTATYG